MKRSHVLEALKGEQSIKEKVREHKGLRPSKQAAGEGLKF